MSVAHYKELIKQLEADLTVSLILTDETPTRFRRKLSLIKTRFGTKAGRLDYHFEPLGGDEWSAVVVFLPEQPKPAPFTVVKGGI